MLDEYFPLYIFIFLSTLILTAFFEKKLIPRLSEIAKQPIHRSKLLTDKSLIRSCLQIIPKQKHPKEAKARNDLLNYGGIAGRQKTLRQLGRGELCNAFSHQADISAQPHQHRAFNGRIHNILKLLIIRAVRKSLLHTAL